MLGAGYFCDTFSQHTSFPVSPDISAVQENEE